MSAKAIADAFLKKHVNTRQIRRQLLDANQLSKLACTIGSRVSAGLQELAYPSNGTRMSFSVDSSVGIG